MKRLAFILSNVFLFVGSVAWRLRLDFHFQQSLRVLGIKELPAEAVKQLIAVDIAYAALLSIAAYRLVKFGPTAQWTVLLSNLAVIYTHLLMPAFYAWYTDTGLKDAALLVVKPIGFVLATWAVTNCLLLAPWRPRCVSRSVNAR